MEVPMGSGVQLGLGEGPINEVVPMSKPCGTINTVSRTLYHTHALNGYFLKQCYSRQLRVTCILICRGAASHRAQASITRPIISADET